MADLGDPTSYLELADGVPVYSADGDRIGTVEHVLADVETDIFDGLIVAVDDGHRFVDGAHVADLFERGAVLALSSAACGRLPEPSANPAVLATDPDDTTPDDLRDKLRRAWAWISGDY